MLIETLTIQNLRIAEVQSDALVIATSADALDMLGSLYYQDFDGIILQARHITPDFFDLKTGMAGEVLQKFSNYRMRLAIVGDFSAYGSRSLQEFIFESNKGGLIHFAASRSEVLAALGA